MPEHQSIEWKSSWQEDHLKALCGFANAQGRCLVLGRDDTGHVIGLSDAKKLVSRYIDAWGREIERILTACQDAKCPQPEIDYTAGDFWLKFPFSAEYVSATITEPSSVKTPVKILQLQEEKPDLSLAELASLIGKSASTIERASAKLLKSGKLPRIRPA
jgi:predicted HTH transcriptional regulator